MSKRTVQTMPKKADPDKKIKERTIVTAEGETITFNKQNKTYTSQLIANEKYAAKRTDKVEDVRLRVPKGWGQIMRDYVDGSEKYKSVNAMICDLIKKECGIED